MNTERTGLYQKIQLAKKGIKETKLKKAGWNDYSKYHYFTPEQIEQLVYEACEANGLFTKFDLIRNELGVYGVLHVIDIEDGNGTDYVMATAIPEIKATNIAQQLGGCATYTERYLKQTAFGISENVLDFDAQKPTANTAATPTPTAPKAPEPEKWLNVVNKQGEPTPEWNNILKGIADGKVKSVADVRKYFKVNKEVAQAIEEALKS
jgi:hypothetical protein